jgi:hypothetical protein
MGLKQGIPDKFTPDTAAHDLVAMRCDACTGSAMGYRLCQHREVIVDIESLWV